MPPKSKSTLKKRPAQKKAQRAPKKGGGGAPKKKRAAKASPKKSGSGQKVGLSNLAPEIIGVVLGFFRSVQHEGRDVLAAPDDWAGHWDDVSFVEEAATLANVVNFALCSKATRDVALGDGVWAPHCAAMEANLVVAPREYEEYCEYEDYVGSGTMVTRYLPEELVDPRALDPRAYAALTAFRRYCAVRGFYEGIKQTIDEFGVEEDWDSDAYAHLLGLAGFCLGRVEDRFMDPQWADIDAEMDDDEMEEVFDRITPVACARLTLKCFVLPELSREGVSGHARDILLGGWPHCSPCCGSASTAEFLERLTGLEWPL